MARFGGNEFTSFSIPLVFEGRYFIMEPGNPPLISVVRDDNGKPVFEVMKNEPAANSVTEASKTHPGIVSVSDKTSSRFLYKIRPGSETSVAFGRIEGGEISVRITDKRIEVGSNIIENNTFNGRMVGVSVDSHGGMSIGSPIPQTVLKWLKP